MCVVLFFKYCMFSTIKVYTCYAVEIQEIKPQNSFEGGVDGGGGAEVGLGTWYTGRD